MSGTLRYCATRTLVERVYAEGGIAFVAGWRVHLSAERAAFRRGLLVEAGPDLWELTPAGRAAIGVS